MGEMGTKRSRDIVKKRERDFHNNRRGCKGHTIPFFVIIIIFLFCFFFFFFFFFFGFC